MTIICYIAPGVWVESHTVAVEMTALNTEDFTDQLLDKPGVFLAGVMFSFNNDYRPFTRMTEGFLAAGLTVGDRLTAVRVRAEPTIDPGGGFPVTRSFGILIYMRAGASA